jgi:hypothetical protein
VGLGWGFVLLLLPGTCSRPVKQTLTKLFSPIFSYPFFVLNHPFTLPFLSFRIFGTLISLSDWICNSPRRVQQVASIEKACHLPLFVPS